MEHFIWEHVVSLMLSYICSPGSGTVLVRGAGSQEDSELWLGGICGCCRQKEPLRWFLAITKLCPGWGERLTFTWCELPTGISLLPMTYRKKNPFTCLICQLKAKQNTPHNIYRLGFRQLASLPPPWWITAIDLMSFNAACKQQKSAQPKPLKPLGNPQVFAVVLSACNNDGQRLFGSPVRGQIRRDLHST